MTHSKMMLVLEIGYIWQLTTYTHYKQYCILVAQAAMRLISEAHMNKFLSFAFRNPSYEHRL